jgi:hypothetical protein
MMSDEIDEKGRHVQETGATSQPRDDQVVSLLQLTISRRSTHQTGLRSGLLLFDVQGFFNNIDHEWLIQTFSNLAFKFAPEPTNQCWSFLKDARSASGSMVKRPSLPGAACGSVSLHAVFSSRVEYEFICSTPRLCACVDTLSTLSAALATRPTIMKSLPS